MDLLWLVKTRGVWDDKIIAGKSGDVNACQLRRGCVPNCDT
jgi:hypothetical protein